MKPYQVSVIVTKFFTCQISIKFRSKISHSRGKNDFKQAHTSLLFVIHVFYVSYSRVIMLTFWHLCEMSDWRSTNVFLNTGQNFITYVYTRFCSDHMLMAPVIFICLNSSYVLLMDPLFPIRNSCSDVSMAMNPLRMNSHPG